MRLKSFVRLSFTVTTIQAGAFVAGSWRMKTVTESGSPIDATFSVTVAVENPPLPSEIV